MLLCFFNLLILTLPSPIYNNAVPPPNIPPILDAIYPARCGTPINPENVTEAVYILGSDHWSGSTQLKATPTLVSSNKKSLETEARSVPKTAAVKQINKWKHG